MSEGPQATAYKAGAGGRLGGLSTAFYLVVGAWQGAPVNPTVWCFGPALGLLRYSIGQPHSGQVQGQARVGAGNDFRPRTWQTEDGSLSPATALLQLEARQNADLVT